MAATKKVADGNRDLNKINIILIVIFAVAVIGGPILVYGLEYIAGRLNNPYFFFRIVGLLLLLFLIVPLVAVVTFIVTLISLMRWHRTVGQILFKLAVLLIVPATCFCAFEYVVPHIVPLVSVFMEGFGQWALQKADVDAIQTWLVNEGAKHAGERYRKRYHAGGSFSEELPECLVNLNPVVISFTDSDSRNGLSVEINWFVRDGNYGLIVGHPEMEMPQEGRIKLDTGGYEDQRPVKPGAYIFFRVY